MYLRSVAALAARAVQLRRAVSVAALRPDIFRRILFDPPVALLVLLQMLAVPGSTEASSTSPRRSVRVVWWGVVMLATKLGGPVGGASAYFDLCVLRMLGHVATLLLGGPVLWEPIRVPVGHERRGQYRRFLGYLATPGTACVLSSDGQRRVDTLHALEIWEVYVGRRGWRFYVAA